MSVLTKFSELQENTERQVNEIRRTTHEQNEFNRDRNHKKIITVTETLELKIIMKK